MPGRVISSYLRFKKKHMGSGCGSVWLERYLREVEAASSNLVTPMIIDTQKGVYLFLISDKCVIIPKIYL